MSLKIKKFPFSVQMFVSNIITISTEKQCRKGFGSLQIFNVQFRIQCHVSDKTQITVCQGLLFGTVCGVIMQYGSILLPTEFAFPHCAVCSAKHCRRMGQRTDYT